MRKVIIFQFIILLAGTLFAWGNFGYELYNWIKIGKQTGCAIGAINPFFTPCFFGAIFFTIAFVSSYLLLIRSKNTLEK